MAKIQSDQSRLDELAEAFVERYRRGERPPISEYVRKHPDLAEQIEELFPALVMMEQAESDLRKAVHKPAAAEPASPITQLGDFRIIREVGRGGMGIVYEAEQVSLGRRVALKLLPKTMLADAQHRKRFEREARAAGRLHHTNIVPVYGVGQQDGMHYYVMQFIHGLALDEVLVELKRLRKEADAAQRRKVRGTATDHVDAAEARPELAAVASAVGDAATRGVLAVGIAQSLASGRFDWGLPEDLDSSSASTRQAENPAKRPADAREIPAASGATETLVGRRSETLHGSGAFTLPGQGENDSKVYSRTIYWQSVARIGVQAAEALQYAHEQGIIHRDVKPGNLLLDTRGCVWITDFGLAKAADQQNLTHTGDVLGTLRYMTPEQFDGKADPRSDVYSLGLTLYELLALQPAFDQTDRRQLVKQVMTETPAALRRIDAHIPTDLATIVQKAIEREPSHRYPTAAELADDLKRYLNDLPIRARKTSLPARLGRWARRNPALALLAMVLLLLTVGSPLVAIRFGRLAQQARAAQREAQHRQYVAERSQAMAWRVSGRAGQQFNTVRALAAAVDLHRELGRDAADLDAMRDEAIAALALPDLRPEMERTASERLNLSLVHFDPNLEHYTTWSGKPSDAKGLSIRRVADDSEAARLRINGLSQKVRFSPDGRWIRLTHVTWDGEESAYVEVWDWRREQMVYRVPKKAMKLSHDFSPDSKLLAVGHEDATVTVHDLAQGEQIAEIAVAAAPIVVAFHPTEPWLAASCQTANCVQVWGLEPLRLLRTLPHPDDVFSMAWSPRGRFLAVVESFDIHLWDLASAADTPFRILRGHSSMVGEMLFHPNGRLLYSHSWNEGRTRVWDPFRGQQLFWCDGLLSSLSRDGRRFGFRTFDKVGVWSVGSGDVYLTPPTYGPETPRALLCQYSPEGQLLASAGAQGVQIWSPHTWELLAEIPNISTYSVCFDAATSSLWGAHDGKLVRYPLRRDGARLHLGPGETLELPAGTFAFHVALAGKTLLADLNQSPDITPTGQAVLIDLGSLAARRLIGPPELRYVALTADGKWAATGNRHGAHVTVWNVKTGALAKELPTESTTLVAFSPDSRRLATASSSEVALWEVGSWKKLRPIPRSGAVGAVAWSPDSRLLAATTGSRLQLIEAASGRILATLVANESPGYFRWMAFRPQGDQLAVCCDGDGLRVWDLHKLRAQLRQIGLDWRSPKAP